MLALEDWGYCNAWSGSIRPLGRGSHSAAPESSDRGGPTSCAGNIPRSPRHNKPGTSMKSGVFGLISNPVYTPAICNSPVGDDSIRVLFRQVPLLLRRFGACALTSRQMVAATV